MHVHCSASGTPLVSGHGFCSGCGLQLTAIAMPTPAPRKLRRQPLLPMWAWMTIALMILVALATTSSQH